MPLSPDLQQRSGGCCELCTSSDPLSEYDCASDLPQRDGLIAICENCHSQLKQGLFEPASHWSKLSDTMWSPVAAVQVTAWRILSRLRDHAWAQDLLDMLYLDEDLQTWAKHGWSIEAPTPSRDSLGNLLLAGDTVSLIKDLDVKGTSFVAKRGTVVRGISLTENPEHIEGKVNGTRIVILTCFVKKVG